ncbi:MAG: Gfo/Idh/MocA family oxidoreductase [Acidobacteria bacterium]|nr:Gfo/Idh/MocA family oxidoreductase [Acidobacteriota bacterium]
MIRFRQALPLLAILAAPLEAQDKLRVGIAGLAHGHATGFFRTALTRPDVEIVGISEADSTVVETYLKRFPALDRARIHPSHAAMLDKAKPEVVMIFSNTFDHREIVELAAARRIHAMMEKPLAVSVEHARAMAEASRRGGIHVMVNYETTWYPVNEPIWRLAHDEKKLGAIRRIVTHYGHQGPKEIGVGPEFLAWLTDPVKNGAGALFDFGCYGANFATWLFDNQRPLSVTAQTHSNKPQIYGRVDDEATVIVQYPKAQLVIQPSWNWPVSRKDMEVYGESGYLITANRADYRVRAAGARQETQATAPPLAAPEDDVIRYLAAVVRAKLKPAGLSGLENNLIVTEILAAARESARVGRTIHLKP